MWMRPGSRTGEWIAVLIVLAGTASAAQPLDLEDPEPREIAVAFESSPRESPGQLDTHYANMLPARLSPGADLDEIEVRVAGHIVERYLMAAEHPKPGSFSDFVWIFDRNTREVRSATLTGVVVKEISIGFVKTTLEVDIEVSMDTAAAGGFRPARRWLGHLVHGFCRPGEVRDCTAIEPQSLDPFTGYVNAVGPISAKSSFKVGVENFSPFGEAMFFEQGDALVPFASSDVPEVASAPPGFR